MHDLCAFKRLAPTFLLICGFLATWAPANAEQTFRMATGPELSDYHAVGKAINSLIKLKRQRNFNIGLQTVVTQGVEDNINALLRADVDIAFVDANTLLKAMNRKKPFEDLKNGQDLRVIMPLWPNIAHILVADTLNDGDNLAEIKTFSGEVLYTGPPKSHASAAARDLLTRNGLYYDRLFRVAPLKMKQAFQAFANGGLPAMVYFTSPNNHDVKKLMTSRETPPVFMSINRGQIARMNEGIIPIWRPYTLPANTYPNQPNAIETVSQYNYLVVRKSFSNEIAARITQVLFENPVFLKMLNPAAHHIDFGDIEGHTSVSFHNGAQDYFKKKDDCKTIFCLF